MAMVIYGAIREGILVGKLHPQCFIQINKMITENNWTELLLPSAKSKRKSKKTLLFFFLFLFVFCKNIPLYFYSLTYVLLYFLFYLFIYSMKPECCRKLNVFVVWFRHWQLSIKIHLKAPAAGLFTFISTCKAKHCATVFIGSEKLGKKAQ